MELKDTVKLMNSKDYKERFKGEYWQLKIRYEKLKSYCNKIEASQEFKGVLEPVHTCSLDLLREQQAYMGNYLHILEIRAIGEGVDLNEINE